MALPTYNQDYGAPCDEAVVVDVSAVDQPLIPPARELYIGVSGDVSVNMERTGEAIVLKAVPVGMLKIRVDQINHMGTTATNIIALY